jgi:hypothetical protein
VGDVLTQHRLDARLAHFALPDPVDLVQLGGVGSIQAEPSWVSACVPETVCALSVVVVVILDVAFRHWWCKTQGTSQAGRPLRLDLLHKDLLGIKIPAKGSLVA